jgi:hypothetical protein
VVLPWNVSNDVFALQGLCLLDLQGLGHYPVTSLVFFDPHEWLGQRNDLEFAIEHFQETLRPRLTCYPDRTGYLNNNYAKCLAELISTTWTNRRPQFHDWPFQGKPILCPTSHSGRSLTFI